MVKYRCTDTQVYMNHAVSAKLLPLKFQSDQVIPTKYEIQSRLTDDLGISNFSTVQPGLKHFQLNHPLLPQCGHFCPQVKPQTLP